MSSQLCRVDRYYECNLRDRILYFCRIKIFFEMIMVRASITSIPFFFSFPVGIDQLWPQRVSARLMSFIADAQKFGISGSNSTISHVVRIVRLIVANEFFRVRCLVFLYLVRLWNCTSWPSQIVIGSTLLISRGTGIKIATKILIVWLLKNVILFGDWILMYEANSLRPIELTVGKINFQWLLILVFIWISF